MAKPSAAAETYGQQSYLVRPMQTPFQARASYVLVHGAGAGVYHPFMVAVATELASRGIATLRYQFPYMERHARRPDPPQLAQTTVRAAVTTALDLLPNPPIAGGKSFGGRMTPRISAASGRSPIAGARAAHLFDVQIPMLFLQGTRDTLASLDQIEPLCKKLGKRATLKLFADADHSFHVPARSERKDAQVLGDMIDAFATWSDDAIAPFVKKS